jgi:hypothetical protein
LECAIERERRIAKATRPIRKALGQAEHYTDMRGMNHPLAQMSATEAVVVLALLERHALTLYRGEIAQHLLDVDPSPRAEQTAAAAYCRLCAASAEDWLRQTPLHRALTERAGQ